MRKRSSKNYDPIEARLGYSGVHESELSDFLRWLEEHGAREIEVQLDDGDYTGYPEGPYYLVDFKKGRKKKTAAVGEQEQDAQ